MLKEAVMNFSNRFSPGLRRVFLLACCGAIRQLRLFAALLAALATAQPAAAAPPASAQERQIDALFARWNHPDTPGAVVAVIRDGKVLLSKAYGMADLERGVPLTAESKMTVGSNSKQFTAFAIKLRAPIDEFRDSLRPLGDKNPCGRPIHKPVARGNRVFEVQSDVIVALGRQRFRPVRSGYSTPQAIPW